MVYNYYEVRAEHLKVGMYVVNIGTIVSIDVVQSMEKMIRVVSKCKDEIWYIYDSVILCRYIV